MNQRAWIAIAKAPSSLFYGVHDGYDDEPSNYYEYDSLVGNHKQVSVGDLLFVRSDKFLLGFGQIESITMELGTKDLRKCPVCGGRPEQRTKTPLPWRCISCKHQCTTDDLTVETKVVTRYRAEYSRTWQDANRPIGISALKKFQDNKDTQSAIRRLDPTKVTDLVSETLGAAGGIEYLNAEFPDLIIGGHSITITKRRRGQQEFRLALLDAVGPECLIAGKNPECVLEAAHIRSFAKFGSHSLDGGLLLRRDFHALFDRRLIRIHPETWRVEASPAIRKFETYDAIHLRKVTPPSKNPPNPDWLMEPYQTASATFGS
jgi:ribosomal protein L37AE/L43A